MTVFPFENDSLKILKIKVWCPSDEIGENSAKTTNQSSKAWDFGIPLFIFYCWKVNGVVVLL